MKKITALRLRIDVPCMENWNEMTPNEQGRFCAVCQRTVVDFSQMTDTQLLDYFRNYQGERLCGRIQQMRLAAAIERKTPLQRLAAAVVGGSMLLSATGCNGWFVKEPEPEVAGMMLPEIHYTFEGNVTDGKENLPQVTIKLFDETNNIVQQGATDENGNFFLPVYQHGVIPALHYVVEKDGFTIFEGTLDSTQAVSDAPTQIVLKKA